MDTQTAEQKDWHPADVKAALEKRGKSLRQLAHAYGYTHIARVLKAPWLAAERIVADALGEKPETIWPSRYALPRDRAHKQTRKPKAARLLNQQRTSKGVRP